MADTVVGIDFTPTTMDKMFKVMYDKRSYVVFNTATPLLSKIKRDFTFKGKNRTIEAVLGFTGSVSSGSLPDTNVQDEQNAVLSRKKLYATISLDREAMLASKGDEAAFESASERQVKNGVKSFTRNLSRQLFALENGKLFEGDNATNVSGAGTAGSPYIVRALSTTFVRGFIEKGDFVNVASETTPLEITAVNYTTRDVSLRGTSATIAAAVGAPTTAKIYMQKSKDNDTQSILAATKGTSLTLYGLSQTTLGARWQSTQLDAASAAVSPDLINQIVSDQAFVSGEAGNLIVTSFKQLRKIKNFLGDKLRYMAVENSDPLFRKAKYNFQGVEWMTDDGPVPIVADRMCPDDHLLSLNTDYITMYLCGAPKWADEDGTVLLRSASADTYGARYIAYGETFVHPHAQAVLYGLA